jgi:hypothetical protein
VPGRQRLLRQWPHVHLVCRLGLLLHRDGRADQHPRGSRRR